MERDELIKNLTEKIEDLDNICKHLKEQVIFKDHTLDFTHKKLINY